MAQSLKPQCPEHKQETLLSQIWCDFLEECLIYSVQWLPLDFGTFKRSYLASNHFDWLLKYVCLDHSAMLSQVGYSHLQYAQDCQAAFVECISCVLKSEHSSMLNCGFFWEFAVGSTYWGTLYINGGRR